MADFLSYYKSFFVSLCFWKHYVVQNYVSYLLIQEIFTDTYYVPGTIVLDTEDTSVNQIKILPLLGHLSVSGTCNS